MNKKEIIKQIEDILKSDFGKNFDDASNNEIYRAVSSVVNRVLMNKREQYEEKQTGRGAKRIYYISMEFLMGRSLKTGLYNLGLNEEFDADVVQQN